MATYYGDYQSDCGKTFQRVKLSVYWVDITVGTRGIRSNTSIEEDTDYLPDIWFEKVFPVVSRQAYCDIPNRMRYALIWLTDSRYLHVDIPFLPGSNDYYFFFTGLAYKLKGKGKTIGLTGELIDPSWLKFYA